MNFQFPGLLGPGYLALYAAVALPILIHLINMLRHRRVEWAAMEFLLASHKKHRTWVRLKQLLLLLMRICALAAVALMVAQPLMNNQLARIFGSTRTHHIVLLDDSLSMSDQWADTSAFAEAKRAIERLGKAAADRPESQEFTLIRFSQVGRAQPDLLQEVVNREQFVPKLAATLERISCSVLATDGLPALREIGQLLSDDAGERRIVYIFSDYRLRDWNDASEAQRVLGELAEKGVELHLINCVDRARPNLAITDLEPAEGVQAAQVPFQMRVTVQNFGDSAARDVPIQLEEDGHSRSAVTIASIPPGRKVTQTFPVSFATAGDHQVVARLDADAVSADNTRYGILSVPAEVPVLLIDGDPSAVDAKYVGIACAPGGSVKTGLLPQIETPRYLSLKPLDAFRAINLLNVDHLDASAIEAIERYLDAGGGVAVFLGERVQPKFVNEQLYRDGKGFFPLPLRGAVDLPVDRLERAPDINPSEHFIFSRGLSDPFVGMLSVQRYFAAADQWNPPADSTIEVIARLRNGDPLAVVRTFGRGRVVVFLTTAAPVWNNWARTPSFVVLLQDLQAFLAQRPGESSRLVGTPLELRLDAGQYQPSVRFLDPAGNAPTGTIQAVPAADGALTAAFADTLSAGVYQAVLTKSADAAVEIRRFAYNVDAAEGDLAVISKTDLAARLKGVPYTFSQADMFQYSVGELAGYNLTQFLLFALVLLLLGEQLVAYSAGYHPAAQSKGGAR